MLSKINDTPAPLKFLLATGAMGIFFGSPAPDTIGLGPHSQVLIVVVLMIALLIWVIYGERYKGDSTPAE